MDLNENSLANLFIERKKAFILKPDYSECLLLQCRHHQLFLPVERAIFEAKANKQQRALNSPLKPHVGLQGHQGSRRGDAACQTPAEVMCRGAGGAHGLNSDFLNWSQDI